MIQALVDLVFGEISELYHPGSPNQGLKDTGSQIRVRNNEFKYFYPKKLLLALGNMIPNDYPGPGFLSWIQRAKKHWIPDPVRNTMVNILFFFVRRLSPAPPSLPQVGQTEQRASFCLGH
jgi:hypothetical protein